LNFWQKFNNNWKLPFSESSVKSLENYATNNINPLRAHSRLNLVYRIIGYFINEKYILTYLRQSLIEVVDFSNSVLQFFRSFKDQELPLVLITIRERFLTFRNFTTIKLLSEKLSKRIKIPFADVFYFDGLLRSEY
jgi:hypothetical protein